MKKFAIIGIAGFVAPKHLQAIKNIGGEVVVAHDISDAVGILDAYFPTCAFFTQIDDFSNYIKKNNIDFLVVCTPNYLHTQHCIFGLEHQVDVICEKPLVLSVEELQELRKAEEKHGKKIYTILQLRLHEEVIFLKNNISKQEKYNGELTYFTPRGNWYHESWKGIEQKSGGIATNIGVHFFDMLCLFFGQANKIEILEKSKQNSKGILHFDNATIRWHLSIDRNLVPTRKITLNKKEYIFTDGFHQLHTTSYQNILDDKGFGIDEVLASTKIIDFIKNRM
jgi:UDP-N-acetyl-2-amino-2-deoxyglucuronate dehydrogenase